MDSKRKHKKRGERRQKKTGQPTWLRDTRGESEKASERKKEKARRRAMREQTRRCGRKNDGAGRGLAGSGAHLPRPAVPTATPQQPFNFPRSPS